MLNFHPGSHVRQGVDVGVRYIVQMLDAVMTAEVNTPILLETMAGKGSEVGRSFEELRPIIVRRRLATDSACVWIHAMFTTRDMTWSVGLTTCLPSLTACWGLLD